ncbi:MAG: hypothetical protein JKY42_04730 [Flavobacteriales bacterium]|nr:hypothetical protein [Flavobacteriales bacterium]
MNILKRIFQNISFSYCLFTLALLIWGLNKGLDLSDEGYYLMSLKFPSEYFSANQWGSSILSLFTGWFNPGIISYRVIRLALTVLSSSYLAFQLSKFIKNELGKDDLCANIFIVFVFVFSGATLSYSIYPATISYNSLTVIFLQLAAGQVINLLSTESKKSKTNILLVGLGVTLMMLFIAKFSTGAIMLLIVLAAINCRRILLRSSYKELILDGIYLGGGAFLFSIIIYTIDNSNSLRIERILEEITYRPGGEIFGYIYGYYSSISKSLEQIRNQLFWAPILLFCVGLLSYWQKNRIIIVSQTITVMTVFTYIAYEMFVQNIFDSMYTMIHPYIILLLSVSALLAGALIGSGSLHRFPDGKKRVVRVIFVILLLGVIPLVGTMGTNNPLTIQSILYLFSWSSLIFVLTAIYCAISKNQVASYSILIVFLFLAGNHLYTGMVHHPYRVAQSLNELNRKLPECDIYVDDKVYNYVTKIENILAQKVALEENHPMLDMNFAPGLVYLLNGKSPGVIWSKKNLSPWYSKRLSESTMQNLEKTILFIPSGGIGKQYISTLKSKGILYPENYTSIGQVAHYRFGYVVYIMVPNSIIN